MNTTFFLDKVAEFHAAFRVYDPGNLLDQRVNALRISLMREETNELEVAIDRTSQLDALCDLQYVLSGSALAWGLRDDRFLTGASVGVKIGYQINHIRGVLSEMEIYLKCGSSKIISWDLWAIQSSLARCVRGGRFAEVFEAAFAEVHRSNMSKLWTALETLDHPPKEEIHFEPSGVDGKYIVKREDGKVLKSPSYSPANLAQFV